MSNRLTDKKMWKKYFECNGHVSSIEYVASGPGAYASQDIIITITGVRAVVQHEDLEEAICSGETTRLLLKRKKNA